MNVLLFSSLFPNQAQPRHGIFVETRLRQTLKRHDFQARVVAPVPWFPFSSPRFGTYAAFAKAPKCETRDGLSIEHPRYPVIPKVGMTIAPYLMARWSLPTLQRLEAEQSIDVIDAHYFYPDGVAAAWLAKRMGKPLIITGRGTDLNVIPDYPRPRRMIVAAAKQASAIVTVSQPLKEKLLALGVDGNKITVLRNGVDLERFTPLRKEEARSALGLSAPLVLSVGNLVPLKGHDLIVRALPQLPGVHLAIVGEGAIRGEIEALIRELGLGDRVKLIGEVPQGELARYYSAADALVLASSREGWANVLLESMACDTPVAATPVSGTEEMIASPQAGTIIEERSPKGIAGAVRHLLDNPPASGTTRQFAEHFNWDDVAAGQYQIFQRASGRPTGSTRRTLPHASAESNSLI